MYVCRCLVVVLVPLFIVTPAWSGLRVSTTSRGAAALERDGRQTMEARRLLANDPDLAALNIGVVVTDRVAVLWGPVPSEEVAYRAELCLRGYVELVKIRNELFVSDLVDPIRVPLKIDLPPTHLPAPKLPRDARPIIGAPGLLTTTDKTDTKTLTAKKPVEVKVLPPETQPALRLPQPEEIDRAIAAAIRMLLQSKATYRTVEFTVKDRRVYLKAPDQDTDALHEAARAVSRLPNVDGVVLMDKAAPR